MNPGTLSGLLLAVALCGCAHPMLVPRETPLSRDAEAQIDELRREVRRLDEAVRELESRESNARLLEQFEPRPPAAAPIATVPTKPAAPQAAAKKPAPPRPAAKEGCYGYGKDGKPHPAPC